MSTQPIDYDALAKQHGGVVASSAIDYDALAKQHGGVEMQAQSEPQKEGFWGALGHDVAGMIKPDAKSYITNLVLPGMAPAVSAVERIVNGSAAAEDRQRKADNRSVPYRVAAQVAPALTGVNAVGMEGAANKGDTAGVIGHAVAPVAVMAATAGLAKAGAKVLPKGTISDLGPTGNQAKVMPKAAGALPPSAIAGAEDVFRASAPTGTKVGFRENVYKAAGDLAEIGQKIDLSEAKGGIINPDMRVRATVDAINDHLSEMYQQERAPQVQRNAGTPVNLSVKAVGPDSIEGLNYLSRTAGQASDRALAAKAIDGGSLTLAEADQLAQVANKELKGFESMTPAERAAASMTNRRLGGLKSLDTWMGKQINKTLIDAGEPGLNAYERRYAALSEIRDQLQRRMNAVELDQPGLVKGVVKPIASLVAGGKTGLASASQAAIADVNIGKMLQRGLKRLSESGAQPERPTGSTR